VPLLNKTLEDNAIYSTPIVVIAGWKFRKRMNENDRFFFFIENSLGISHNSLRMCLETILMQPGIVAENVIVRKQICFWF